jgi:aryl-alcohol dehydrogenase-like predicted oxidoreductase
MLLGQFAKSMEHLCTNHDLVLATKFVLYPWRITRKSFFKALKTSNKRMGIEKVGLYQIHMPLPPLPVETWVKAVVEAVKEGLANAVGVSIFSLDQMRRAKEILEKEGVPLASNKVNYNLLDRSVEHNGLLSACKEYGIILLAYSPLAKGRLTGKYSPDNPMPGLRGRIFTQNHLRKIQPLIELLREIGSKYGSKTPSQVALNWLICKGAVPIPGAKNASQVYDNVGALGWRLSEEDITRLDEMTENL